MNSERETQSLRDRRQPIRSYRDIEAYQRAMELLAPLHRLLLTFPEYERYELASQLRRASKSIPANIAEGYGKKGSVRQFGAYLSHAIGSANEVIVYLEVAQTLGYATKSDVEQLVDGYTIVAKQLHRLRESWRAFDSKETGASRLPPPASNIQQGEMI